MSRDFGPKTCDFCFNLIEGRTGNYCSESCRQADLKNYGLEDNDDDEQGEDPDRYKDDGGPEPLNQ